MSPSPSREEIHDRVRRGYLDRLGGRLRRMRRLLSDREWNALRIECANLRNTARSFGLPEVARLAAETEGFIPRDGVTRALPLPEACQAATDLFTEIELRVSRGQPRPLSG